MKNKNNMISIVFQNIAKKINIPIFKNLNIYINHKNKCIPYYTLLIDKLFKFYTNIN